MDVEGGSANGAGDTNSYTSLEDMTGVASGAARPDSRQNSSHNLNQDFSSRLQNWFRGGGSGQSSEPRGVDNINYGLYDDDEDDDELALDGSEAAVDDGGFFARGRDFASTNVNHSYTAQEKEWLASYESLDYLPPDSKIYRRWLRQQPVMKEWDRFLVMGLIGFCVGVIGFLLHQIIDLIANFKWSMAGNLAKSDLGLTWLWVTGYSMVFIIPSSMLVVYLRPSAAGSGMPELIGFLNGTLIRHIFNIKTLVVKFFSCALAVASGMPIGPEGPMIHMGALIGAGVSQFQSKTLGITLPFLARFRNSQDRRNFVSAGAAAGIASAFGAPVGGLLFAMEEVSSYWSLKLSWQTFFCCMVSAFTTDLLDSSFRGFHYDGLFGQFKTDRYIMFNVESGIDMNILALIPCVLLGAIGGGLGAGFTFCNLKIVKLRRKLHARLSDRSPNLLNVVKIAEPALILVLYCTISVLLPRASDCSPFYCEMPFEDSLTPSLCVNSTFGQRGTTFEATVEHYTCPVAKFSRPDGVEVQNGSFSQAATLYFNTGENAIHHLFSRNTHLQFDYFPLLFMLIIYFVLSCWAAGTYISSGLVVPMLLIGGIYGRMLGRLMVDMFGVQTADYWDWIDPGAMALLGAVSFFGGVTRLTMSLTVIMVEMTNDIQFLLLIMTTVMVSKWVGDFATHPIYHALLELKCIPYLEQEPVVQDRDGRRLNLEMFQAGHVMQRPVVTLHRHEKVSRVANVLLDTRHGGFPVVGAHSGTFKGLISRSELIVLLMQFHDQNYRNDAGVFTPTVFFPELSAQMNRKIRDPADLNRKLTKLSENTGDFVIDMSDYVNTSAVAVPAKFSLQRLYIVFRSLGLRHLVVLADNSTVAGIITRKDLMGFALEDKLAGVTEDMVDGNLTSRS